MYHRGPLQPQAWSKHSFGSTPEFSEVSRHPVIAPNWSAGWTQSSHASLIAKMPASMREQGAEEMLKEFIASREQTSQDQALQRGCLLELRRLVSQMTVGWHVYPFGSAANGFAMHGSDLDLTVCRVSSAADATVVPARSSDMQELMMTALTMHDHFEILEVVSNARIPILRLRYQALLDVDLSVDNAEPLPNTQLLRAYAALDPSIRDVVVVVKLWAKACQISGAYRGHLSPYAWTLMVIYYLLVDPAVQMPHLDPELFDGGESIPVAAQLSWACPLSRSELLQRFFAFFATQFGWGSEVVTPRLGQRLHSSDERFDLLRGRQHLDRLHIEDPFLLSRNLHCALHACNEGTVWQYLCDVHWGGGGSASGISRFLLRTIAPERFLNPQPALREDQDADNTIVGSHSDTQKTPRGQTLQLESGPVVIDGSRRVREQAPFCAGNERLDVPKLSLLAAPKVVTDIWESPLPTSRTAPSGQASGRADCPDSQEVPMPRLLKWSV